MRSKVTEGVGEKFVSNLSIDSRGGGRGEGDDVHLTLKRKNLFYSHLAGVGGSEKGVMPPVLS